MKTITILVATLMLNAAAQARLGETSAECVARYGEPLRTDKETMTLGFEKEGILIMCVFHEGKCVEIAYKKKELGEFSEVEIQTLRDLNGKGWEKVENSAIDQQVWRNETSYAVKIIGEGMLIVMTHEQKKRRDDAKAATEKERLKGF